MITRARIHGMSCQHCVRAVFTGLTAVEGITHADVRVGAIEVEHDGRVTAGQLRAAIAAAGYEMVASEEDRRRLPVA